MMDEDSSSKFIGSLTKFLQSLCNGYVEFQSGVELAGHIYLSVDTGKKIDYILHEKVCKNDENSVTFISNSFHAQPIEKAKSAVNHQRSDSSPKPKDLPKSTRDGEILEGKRKKDEEDDDDLVIVESQGTQPESTNIGTVQSKMPHHDRIGPRGLKRVGSPSASQRLNQRSSAQRNNNPVSSTISSSTSPAHQSNQGSSGSMFPSQSNTRQQSAVPSATVTSQGEIQADNFNMGDMKLEQMTTDELLALTSQVNDDSSSSVQALSSSQLQHTSSGSSSGGVEQTGSGQVWVKQEVSDDDICMQGQSGSTGLGSGWPRRQDGLRGAGGNSGGLYPVMLHQNTAAFSGPNTAFPPGFPPLGVGSSQHPGFSQLPSSSQAAGLLPTSLPGSSHDAVGVDQTGFYHLGWNQVWEKTKTILPEINGGYRASKEWMRKKYRDRLKMNPVAYEAFKQSERLRLRRYRRNLSDEVKQRTKEQSRLRQKRFRERRKQIQIIRKDTQI